MKSSILAAALGVLSSFAFVSQANATRWDGCYQLLDTGVMYPAICFQGTTEEGINGSNVRLFVFKTNTNILDVCAIGQVTKMTARELTFEKDGVKEVVLSNFDGSVADAEVDGFRRPVKAGRLSEMSTKTLMKNADSERCK